jgi:hypothetical protein
MNKALFSYSILAAIALTCGSLWAVSFLPIWESIIQLSSDPWFLITILDLYLGFGFVAFFIFHKERSILKSLFWTIGLCLLGNIVTGIYIFLALRDSRKNNTKIWDKKHDSFKFF